MLIIECIKKIIIKNKYYSLLFFSLLRFVNRKSKKEIEKRKSTSLFDFEHLASPFKIYPIYNIMDNNVYGTGKIMNNLKLDVNNSLMEHGLIFGNLVQKHNTYSYAKNIITFSSYREKILSQKIFNKNIIPIGPYILYVKSLLNDHELFVLKKQLGKILMVFPSHSIESITINYSIQFLCNEIERTKEILKFDTIVICLYWKDIQNGIAKEYIDRGYKVTTAGYKYDYYFLDRLKSIIQISDFTMSNNTGTHVGYCICLGKGHYIFNQEKKIYIQKYVEQEINQRGRKEQDSYDIATLEIMNVFSHIEIEPTDNQKEIVKKYWGYEKNNNK